MIPLPEEYIIEKFFQYTHYPKFNRYNNTYQGGCCICREGGSLGKKRRCYYIPKNNIVFCHNCGWSSKPMSWIKKISGQSDIDILNELKTVDSFINTSREEVIPRATIVTPSLPVDSINLSDNTQINFYKNNPILIECQEMIKYRRLDTAVNKPDSLYLSLVDPVHKNRLVIPFINEQNNIEFYQTRTILNELNKKKPKYISRINAEKTLFNINKVTDKYKSVFIFEGPINAFFTKNSVAVAGITEKSQSLFTKRQQEQCDTVLKWYDKIWVLDSQWIDNASLNKSEILLKNGEKVFIWPEKFGKRFKDFNDICIACNVNEIPHEFIEKNTFEGLEGIFRLANIKNNR